MAANGATGVTLTEVADRYPLLFHMAEKGSWDAIRANGLRSTTALLDLYGYAGEKREMVESHKREASVVLSAMHLPNAVVRDNLPIREVALAGALEDGLNPRGWYEMLNQRVFFWVSEERLKRLLNARAYRSKEHDVLVVDTRSLLQAHSDRVTLCAMNSGNTFPVAHRRGLATFRRLKDFPFQDRIARRLEPVVELAVDYAVPDIASHTLRVERRQARLEGRVIWTR